MRGGARWCVITGVTDELGEAVRALREWQHDAVPFQLHPGDLGWHWRFGTAAVDAAVRVWRWNGRIRAVGLLDGPRLLRVTTAPGDRRNAEVARRLVRDVGDPRCGVLPSGAVHVEAPSGALVAELLDECGWQADEPWTPLQRDLADPVPDPGVRIEVAGPELVPVWAGVMRAAFDRSTFTRQRWSAMAEGAPFADARCLLARDERDAPVAVVAVWSAGPGRPGLLEPMGVHRDHRGRGYGRAITLAAAGELRRMGSSSAQVCTPSANAGAVATYEAAGFRGLPPRRDRFRQA